MQYPRLRLHLPLALITGSACCVSLTYAQENVPPALEEVVVTARAAVENANKVQLSYAVSTISSDALRMDAPTGVADALGSIPGFWVESSGGEASANIRARGIPTEGFSTVGMLENGLPIQHDPGLGWLNGDQIFRLDEMVDRIEVVRGGPSSIFTSNAPGGVVNFITRRPGNTPEGVLKLESSDYGLMRLDGWYGTPIGDWKLGFGGFYREDDGVRDPQYTASKGGQFRVTLGHDFEGGSIDFDIKRIDDNVIFYTGLPLTYDSSGDITGVPGIDAGFGTLSGPETRSVQVLDANGPRTINADSGTDIELTQFTARLSYDLPGDWKLQNGMRYREAESSRIGLFPTTPTFATARLDSYRAQALAIPGATDVQFRYVSTGEVFNPVNQNGNGLVVDGPLRQVDVPVDEFVNDARLMRKFELGGQAHDVAFGLYFARVDETFQRYSANSLLEVRDNARLLDVVAVDAAGNVVGTLTENGITRYGSEFANGTGKSSTYALYFSDEWTLNDRWRVDLGGRWERVSVEGRVERSESRNLGDATTIADDNVLAGTGVFDSFDRDFDDFGWTAGVNYQFMPTAGIFARYTSTFRLPNVGDYITNASARPIIQTMDFIELGYKYATRTLSLYATLFQTKYDSFGFSELVFDPATGSLVSRTEYTDTETRGLELEGKYSPAEWTWFDVGFSATWQNPEFGTFAGMGGTPAAPAPFDFSGNQLIRIPEKSYRVTPAVNLLNDQMRVELDYQYFGSRFSDAANSVTLPSYEVVNANLRYQPTENLTLLIRGENLLDEVGLTEGNPRAGQFQSGEADSPFFVGRPIFGRNFRFSVLWRF